MIFYGFLVVIALAVAAWAIRSPLVKQLRRGRGYDSSQFGNNRIADHFQDQAFTTRGREREKRLKPPKWD